MNRIKIAVAFTATLICTFALSLQADGQSILGTNGFIGTLSTWTVNNPDGPLFKTNDVLELSSGALNNNAQNLELYADVRLNPWSGLATGARMYNDNVLGTVTAVGGYVGWAIVDNTIRITPEIELGYNTGQRAGYAAPTLMAEKGMTDNTYTQLGINMDILFKGKQNFTPGVFVGLGFKW